MIRRRLLPLLLGALFVTPALAEDLPAAGDVLDRYTEALGGEDALREHDSRHMKGKLTMPAQGIEGDLDIYASAPNLFLLRVNIPGMGNVESGFNGTDGWMIQPMTGPMLLEDEALAEVQRQADYYELLKTEDRYDVLETVGKETVEGKECWKLRLVRKGTEAETFEFYDVETGLQVASEGPQETPMGTIQSRTLILEHTEHGGALYPTRLSQEIMGMTQVMTITEVDFTDLDAATFAPPKEIQALLDARPATGTDD
jgi:hypothetical protein